VPVELGDLDFEIRRAMFEFLDRLLDRDTDGSLPYAAINSFEFDGKRIALLSQQGIRKPRLLTAALTICTTYTGPSGTPPYIDEVGSDGLLRYKYQGFDPNLYTNRALREAMRQEVALAYFVGIDKGAYVPIYPVWIVAENQARHEFSVEVHESQRMIDGSTLREPERRYLDHVTRARVHQHLFRSQVLRAYGDKCAMCRLHHPRLLDAAHIIPDGQPDGQPIVPNGLSLCKIHHAAYDANLIGIRRDLRVAVQPRLLEEKDGPMLQHGLQGMAGERLHTPSRRSLHPDPERLETRFEQFLAAAG
jgi:putative restriction endonuclease